MKPTVDAQGVWRHGSAMCGTMACIAWSRWPEVKELKITTFVYPELVSADATMTPPSYSGQPAKTVKNTQKVALMKATQFDYRLN